jgi:NAD(P)H-flavin reductase
MLNDSVDESDEISTKSSPALINSSPNAITTSLL